MRPAEVQSPRVHALAATRDGQIFSATQSGLQRSTDNGRSWRKVAKRAPTTAICVTDDGCILGATIGAVQISQDAGASWDARSLPSRSTIVSAMLATSGSLLAATLEDGVLRSVDGGTTWRGWNFGLLNWRINALCRDSEGVIWAGTESGLFRSDTDGCSWQDQQATADTVVHSLAARADGGLWMGTSGGALHSRINQEADWALAHQWQSPINATCTIGERIAVLHGQTVSFSDGGSRFEAMSYTDATSISWLDKARLLIGTDFGSVHIIDVP